MSHAASLSKGLQFGIVTQNGIASPATVGGLVAVDDAFIRSTENKNLVIQSGNNGSAIYIDTSNNIGIGKNAPAERVDVDGFVKTTDGYKITNQNQAIIDENANLYLSGKADILSDLSANGNLTILGTATIESATTINGLTTINNTLNVTGDISANTNLTILGTATIESATTINDTVTINGLTSINDTLNVTGDISANTNLTILGTATIESATTINDTVTINGLTSINDTLKVTGDISANTNLTILGTATIESATTINDTLTVEGLTTINDTLNVTGDISANTNLTILGTATIEGATTINDTVTINGLTTINDTLNVTGDISANTNLTILGTATIESATTINDTLTVTGITTLQDNLVVDTNTFYVDASNNNVGIGTSSPDSQFKLHVSGDVRIEGGLTINGTTTVIDTNVQTTERLVVTNDGTGPALEINQLGSQSIAQFKDDNNIVLEIEDGGHVNITDSVSIGNNLDVSNNVDISGNVSISGITTVEEELYVGLAFMGKIDTSNNAFFSHKDNKNTSDFAIMQTSSGKTIVNSKTSATEINFTFGGETNIKQSFDKDGNIVAAGNVFTYSDARLKYNIKQITNGLEKVSAIRGVTFNMYQDQIDGKDGRTHVGLIAQEVEAAIPEAIIENNGIKTVAYGNLVGLLIEAIKDLNREINILKTEINTLKTN